MEQKNTEKPRKQYKDDLIFTDDGKIRTWEDHNLQISKREYILEECSQNMKKKIKDKINHPPHYGGKDTPYEAIKVIEAWKLGFNLGNVVKYISRAGKKGLRKEDLKKAQWYINREIENEK